MSSAKRSCKANAFISASRNEMIGSSMYLTGRVKSGSMYRIPAAVQCARNIINAGIDKVYIRDTKDSIDVLVQWIKTTVPAGRVRILIFEGDIYE